MTTRLNYVVSAAESGMKLQAFLKSKSISTISARQIKQSIDAGNCQINGKVERFSSRLVGTGDKIIFYQQEPTVQASQISFNSPERVLYHDNELIIYNKPAGFSSEDPRLLSFIKLFCVETKLSNVNKAHEILKNRIDTCSVQLVHRLDRDTTGVLVFAKDKSIAEMMFTLFKQRHVKKTYLAIVDGIPKLNQGIIDNCIGKITTFQGQTLYGEVTREKGGLHARTVWKRTKAGQNSSLIVCYPETGRTHQLRVHLSGLGHPILGDYQYGRSFTCSFRPARMLLHAMEIAFEHPISKKQIQVAAQLPEDFAEAELFLKLG